MGAIAGLSLVVASAPGTGVRARGVTKAPTGSGRHEAPQRATIVHGFTGSDQAEGKIANLTPYTWTFVTKGRNGSDVQSWDSTFPATLQPGQSFTYKLNPYGHYATTHQYSGFFTYKAGTINHAEYLTIDLEGTHCTGICLPRDGPPLVPKAFNASAAPTHNNIFEYDFGPATPNPEIAWSTGGSANVWPNQNSDFDFSFETRGNYTIDAATSPPQLPGLINAMCAGVKGTTCSFAQVGDIRWSIGDPVSQGTIKSCGAEPPGRSGQRPPAHPPTESPDWHKVSVEAKRTKSVSIGGSISLSAEAELFHVVDAEVTAKIGIEHEWSETTAFEKTTRIYVPRNWVAGVWVAPVIGKVTGTLVVSTRIATYTITHFEQTASGVSRDLLTPAFNIMTNSRPMTEHEYQVACKSTVKPPGTTAPTAAPPPGLG